MTALVALASGALMVLVPAVLFVFACWQFGEYEEKEEAILSEPDRGES